MGEILKKSQILMTMVLTAAFPLMATAQTPPDPLKMTAADLTFEADEKHTKEFHKYFYFHKDGLGYDQALNEIGECNVYQEGPIAGGNEAVPIVPRFVSLSESQSYVPYVYNDMGGGVVGAIIGDMMAAPILQKNKAQRFRKCMEYKGYDRYGVSKDVWKTFTRVDPDDYVEIMASIASGPKPTAEKILP